MSTDPGIAALRNGIATLKNEVKEELKTKKGYIYHDRLEALDKLDDVLERQSAEQGNDSYGS